MLRWMSEKNTRRLTAGLISLGAGFFPLVEIIFPVPFMQESLTQTGFLPIAWNGATATLLATAAAYLFSLDKRQPNKGHRDLGWAVSLSVVGILLLVLGLIDASFIFFAGVIVIPVVMGIVLIYVFLGVSSAVAFRHTRSLGRFLLIFAAVFLAIGPLMFFVGGEFRALAFASLPISFLCRAAALLLPRREEE